MVIPTGSAYCLVCVLCEMCAGAIYKKMMVQVNLNIALGADIFMTSFVLKLVFHIFPWQCLPILCLYLDMKPARDDALYTIKFAKLMILYCWKCFCYSKIPLFLPVTTSTIAAVISEEAVCWIPISILPDDLWGCVKWGPFTYHYLLHHTCCTRYIR